MPQAGLKRKDLSLILRYIFSKQELKPADRNLLRRILVANFQQDIVVAGSKKFVHFLRWAFLWLRLKEGKGRVLCESSHFYFLLKGRGIVSSDGYTYEIQSGDYFGHAELLSQTNMEFIDFEANYLMLTINESEFNLCFRESLLQRF